MAVQPTPGARQNTVETEWLAANLNAPDIVVVDGSWYLPAHGRDPNAEYRTRRIPGAVRFDIDVIVDTTSGLPHTLPGAAQFASAMRKLGIGDGQRVVVYDGIGLFSAPRVWWALRTMGATDVVVLNGGFPKWEAEGHPIDDMPPLNRQPRHFSARRDNTVIRTKTDVANALDDDTTLVLDARPADRFAGTAPEPRPGVRAGHMPGSLNIPFDLLVTQDGCLKHADELRAIFTAAGWVPGTPVITSCGSGVTAALLTLALAQMGETDNGLYDGSWAEWGADHDLPVVSG
ncbi:MAG: 3-mercaptopyruvate sulfurtransferase [Pseudomonadota bacterium]